jgi:two-component system OmpR family sensor kinase
MKSWDPRRNVHARLLAIVVGALALALAASTYGFNVLYARSTSLSADSLLRARASSELGLLSLRHGRLVASEIRNDSLGDSQVWIFTRTGTLERPNNPTRLDAVALALAGGPRRLIGVHGDDRLYAVPIVIHGRREGTLVTGLSLAPYKQSQSTALRGSLALALLMLTLVGAAVWWLLRSALRPVARMTEQAAAWSEHDLDRRFGLGEPNDELTQLAATLDALLDRLAASLRHERRFSAELSHELRTPLSRLIAEAELALRRERPAPEYRLALEAALRNAHQVGRIVETLVAAAQHEAGARGTSDAYDVAADAVGEVSQLAGEHAVSLVVDQPQEPLRLGVDGDLAERVLQPVIENACRYARTWARVTVTRRDSTILYLIEDDGPGVEPPERETIFEPGVRGSAGRNESGSVGAGLGLALARRLARTAAGDVVVEPNGAGGRFLVALPAA